MTVVLINIPANIIVDLCSLWLPYCKLDILWLHIFFFIHLLPSCPGVGRSFFLDLMQNKLSTCALHSSTQNSKLGFAWNISAHKAAEITSVDYFVIWNMSPGERFVAVLTTPMKKIPILFNSLQQPTKGEIWISTHYSISVGPCPPQCLEDLCAMFQSIITCICVLGLALLCSLHEPDP